MHLDRLKVMALTGCGLGFAPVASGTFGTLPGVVLAVLAQGLVPAEVVGLVWLGMAVALLLLGFALGPFANARFRAKDPRECVLDEVVGYLVTVACLALTGPPPLAAGHLAAFLVFRAADVLKPPPARQLESLPGGYGIMMDDVAAGLYAGLVLVLARDFLGASWL
jgi:phosphatidylglycerophosphatase A